MCWWHRTLMRHIRLAQPITAASFGMLEAASPALLVAPAGGAQRGLTSSLGTTAGTVDLAPVADAADHDPDSAAMAMEEAAWGLHRRFPSRQRAIDRDWPRLEYFSRTLARHGVGHDIGVNFAGLAAVVPVLFGGIFLPHPGDPCHFPLPLPPSAGRLPGWPARGSGACLQSPFGLLATRPATAVRVAPKNRMALSAESLLPTYLSQLCRQIYAGFDRH